MKGALLEEQKKKLVRCVSSSTEGIFIAVHFWHPAVMLYNICEFGCGCIYSSIQGTSLELHKQHAAPWFTTLISVRDSSVMNSNSCKVGTDRSIRREL